MRSEISDCFFLSWSYFGTQNLLLTFKRRFHAIVLKNYVCYVFRNRCKIIWKLKNTRTNLSLKYGKLKKILFLKLAANETLNKTWESSFTLFHFFYRNLFIEPKLFVCFFRFNHLSLQKMLKTNRINVLF